MNTSKPIQVVHSDITITYNEAEDKWQFTLRGRDRSAESLAKAKEYIDKPLPPEKAKPFKKIPAWLFKYDVDTPEEIEVTGIAEDRGYGGGQQVWINKDGKRSKEGERFSIFPTSLKNDEIIAQIVVRQEKIRKLKEEISELKPELTGLVLPKDE